MHMKKDKGPPTLIKANAKVNSALCYKNGYRACGGQATLNEHMKWYNNVKAPCPLSHTWPTSSCTVATGVHKVGVGGV